MNTNLSQNELVAKFTKRNSRRKLTTEQVTIGVNTLLKTKGIKSKLTTSQVSMCLNRLSGKNIVRKLDTYSKNSQGRKMVQWAYIKD